MIDIFKYNTSIEYIEVRKLSDLVIILKENKSIKSALITQPVITIDSETLLYILNSNITLGISIGTIIPEELFQLTCLQSLSITTLNQIPQSALEIIGKRNPNLTSLTLNGRMPSIVIPLFPKLDSFSSTTPTIDIIKELASCNVTSLNINILSNEISNTLAKYIKATKSLTYLNISNSYYEELSPLLQAIADNRSLKELDFFTSQQIKDEFASPILKAVKCNVNLVTCSLPPFSDYILDEIEKYLDENRNYLSTIIWTLYQDNTSYFNILPPEVVAIVAQYLVPMGFPKHRRHNKSNENYNYRRYRYKIKRWNCGLGQLY